MREASGPVAGGGGISAHFINCRAPMTDQFAHMQSREVFIGKHFK